MKNIFFGHKNDTKEIATYKSHLGFREDSLDTRLKYIGFTLKPLDYGWKDWEWIIKKVRKGYLIGYWCGYQKEVECFW